MTLPHYPHLAAPPSPLPAPPPSPVIVKSSLVPFTCTSRNGVRTMDAEPSIVCDVPGGPHARMKPVAIATLVLFAGGLPLFFATFL